MKIYTNISTDEKVGEDEAEQYVLEQLGFTVTPKGKSGELTQEQKDFIMDMVNTYFSGNWIEDDDGYERLIMEG